MLEDFLSYIESNLSVNHEDKILLSVSGGIDSMVMLHLFRQLDYNIEVAHINHSTRNGASDADMAFVKAICEETNTPFHAKTLSYEDLSNGNFQENARNERFDFLKKIKEKYGCKWIGTAHHKDDRWETFLMHLNRKAGIQGLTSLRPIENDIIHPLLRFTKSQILEYGLLNNIDYVHDKSNDTDHYIRNAVRHNISPEIIKIFPSFIDNVNQSINHLEESSELLKELISQNGFVQQNDKNGYTIIALEQIQEFKNSKLLLHQLIEEFGFNMSTSTDMLGASTTGAIFQSANFEALIDRGKLIIRNKRKIKKTFMTLEGLGSYPLSMGGSLVISENLALEIPKHLWIDSKKVKWPLTIRNIQPGDKIKPQGMRGATKTIKKICTDLKINRFEKENLLVVCQEDVILQIIGLRTRNEYTTDDIKNALTFKIVV